ncbi:uncharacterized protein LOC117171747 [Belonocnema kinseyi]|uniref:uncharacterized protein LOC117171747 n=1 Tax=Belonocnema kinseyi TaxID=2817044 RepID=UPI00143DF135|nr:uncharacterized protein LOC117171747 [Belonocnema kinseyi]
MTMTRFPRKKIIPMEVTLEEAKTKKDGLVVMVAGTKGLGFQIIEDGKPREMDQVESDHFYEINRKKVITSPEQFFVPIFKPVDKQKVMRKDPTTGKYKRIGTINRRGVAVLYNRSDSLRKMDRLDDDNNPVAIYIAPRWRKLQPPKTLDALPVPEGRSRLFIH